MNQTDPPASQSVLRKSAQEVELDHLLAEEFACDPGFVFRFLSACGAECEEWKVETVVPEPRLGGEGFGDLLVSGRKGQVRTAILIEDKITAGPAHRQAERYAAKAERMRASGYGEVITVIVAPRSYRGERAKYDHSIDLETVVEIMQSCDPARLEFRRQVIRRALEKKSSYGVTSPDAAVFAFKERHLAELRQRAATAGLDLQLPSLKQAYYDGDTWIEGITTPQLPNGMELRHRCWKQAVREDGYVDLICKSAPASTIEMLAAHVPEGAKLAPYSGGKGWQISLRVAEMRASDVYRSEDAESVVKALAFLVKWSQGSADGVPMGVIPR